MNAKIDKGQQFAVGGRTLSALAHLVAEIRGSTGAAPWQPEGVAPALAAALEHRRARDLAHLAQAAIRAALDPSIRTPAPIALDGRHWHEPDPRAAAAAAARPAPLPRCSGCHAEILTHAGETRESHAVQCKPRIDPNSPARLAARAEARRVAEEGARAAAAAAVEADLQERAERASAALAEDAKRNPQVTASDPVAKPATQAVDHG